MDGTLYMWLFGTEIIKMDKIIFSVGKFRVFRSVDGMFRNR